VECDDAAAESGISDYEIRYAILVKIGGAKCQWASQALYEALLKLWRSGVASWHIPAVAEVDPGVAPTNRVHCY
jgi:hypothetical protein